MSKLPPTKVEQWKRRHRPLQDTTEEKTMASGYDEGEKYDDGPRMGSTRTSTHRPETGDDVPDAGPLQLAQEDSLAAIEGLHMLIAKLHARLAPVLLPERGQNDGSEVASNTVKESKPKTSYLRTREEGIKLGVVRAQMEVDRLIELLDV